MNTYIFKTNIQTETERQQVAAVLDPHEHIQHWNVDMDDCDKVLRIQTAHLSQPEIVTLIAPSGVVIEELPD
jgi:hypothetical protein